MLAGLGHADVGDARLHQGQEVTRVQDHAMAMVAGGTQDLVAIDET